MNYKRKITLEMAFLPYNSVIECVALYGKELNCTIEWLRIVNNARIMCGFEPLKEFSASFNSGSWQDKSYID